MASPGYAIDGLQITDVDMESLGDEALLNDKVINVFSALLQRRADEEAPHEFFLTNTHFFTRMRSNGGQGVDDAANKWYKNRSVLSHRWIFIPVHVHHDQHWWLLAVFNIKEWFLQHCPLVPIDPASTHAPRPVPALLSRRCRSAPPFLVSFDSLGSAQHAVTPTVARWLVKRWFKEIADAGLRPDPERYGGFSEDALAALLAHSVPVTRATVPQQQNGFDCGVFVLHFIDLLTTKPMADFIALQPYYWFKKALQEWFQHSDIDKKRVHLAKQLLTLARVQRQQSDDAAVRSFVKAGRQREVAGTVARMFGSREKVANIVRDVQAWREEDAEQDDMSTGSDIGSETLSSRASIVDPAVDIRTSSEVIAISDESDGIDEDVSRPLAPPHPPPSNAPPVDPDPPTNPIQLDPAVLQPQLNLPAAAVRRRIRRRPTTALKLHAVCPVPEAVATVIPPSPTKAPVSLLGGPAEAEEATLEELEVFKRRFRAAAPAAASPASPAAAKRRREEDGHSSAGSSSGSSTSEEPVRVRKQQRTKPAGKGTRRAALRKKKPDTQQTLTSLLGSNNLPQRPPRGAAAKVAV